METNFPLDPDETLDTLDNDEESVVLNLDEVADELPGFQPLPPGTYSCVVEQCDYNRSKSKGNPQLAWRFKVIEDPYQNRLLFYHTVLNSEAGQIRLRQLLLRVMPDYPRAAFNARRFAEEGVALGRPLRAKVKIDSRGNKPQNSVVDVLPPGEFGSFVDPV